MKANVLSLHTIGRCVGKKTKYFSFLKNFMLHIKLKGTTHAATWYLWQIFCPQTHPPPQRVKGQNIFFSESSYSACRIKGHGV